MKESADSWFRTDLKETASTMLDLLRPELQSRKEEFVLVTADFQTAGRGQRGTVWEAERGKNLPFGFSLRPVFLRAGEQFRLSEILALSIASALNGYTDGGFCIKWPNDIYFGNRKICGMLLEHDLHGGRIAATRTGIGINVNQRTFRSNAPNPVSLCGILGHETDRETLLLRILDEFERRYRKPVATIPRRNICNASTAATECSPTATRRAASGPASPAWSLRAAFCLKTTRENCAAMLSRRLSSN